MIARLARLLRVLRLISALPELRLIVSTLLRSIPGMANVMLLMGVIFYIYAIMGFHLFHEHDPVHWRNVGISLFGAIALYVDIFCKFCCTWHVCDHKFIHRHRD